MDPNDKKILRETFELARDNHKILRKLQSNMRWGRSLRIMYWLVIIAGTLGAYYYIQPFVDGARETLNQIQTATGAVSQGVSETTSIVTKIVEPVLNFGKSILGQ